MSLVNIRKQMHFLIYGVWAFIIIFILGFTMLGAPGNGNRGGGAGGASDTFATIEGKDVPNAEFLSVMNMYQSFAQQAPMEQRQDLPKYAYEQVVQGYASAAAAEAAGVVVSDSEVESEIQREVDQWAEQRLGKDVKPDEREDYKRKRMAQIDRDAVKRQLLSQRLRDKLTKDVKPVEVKVAHILIKTDKRSDAAARQLASDIARRAKAGEDFTKLVQQYSEDAGSKATGGVVGWASANPPTKPTGKDGKPNPNDAQHFVPEFTAASLRLNPGQVSEPVHSSFGYHVIKGLEQRDYQPTDPDSAKDPKKRQQAIESYKSQVASQIEQGLIAEQKAKIQANIQPKSAWLKGYFAEQALGASVPPDPKAATPEQKANAVKEAEKLKVVTDDYTAALKDYGSELGAPLSYKLAGLYQRAGKWYEVAGQDDRAKAQYTAGLDAIKKWVERSGDADLYIAEGDLQQKLGNKTDALASYQLAMERAKEAPNTQHQLIEKFKALGRADLADKAGENEKTQQAKLEERQKQQAADYQKRIAEQAAAQKAAKALTNAPGNTIQVKTDASGKPHVVDVKPGNAPAANAPAAAEKKGDATGAAEKAPAKP